MRILYVVTAYDRRPAEGITPWLVETIQRLRVEGAEVEVLAPSYRGLASGEVDGVMVHRFRYAPRSMETLTHDQTTPDRIRERPWYLALVPGYVAAGTLAARALARDRGYDVIHVHWPLPHAVLGLAARRATGTPLVLSFHGVEITWASRQLRPFRPFLRHAIRRADAVTANSSYTADMIRALHDRQVERIPFGATVAAPGRTARTPPSPPFELLFVGRLVERKGVQVLLEALAELRSRHDVRLHIIGEGALRPVLEERARDLGLADVARFHGFVSNEELAARYESCDAFVLPAVVDAKGDVEGLGVVLVEALSHGRPVIASDAGGIPDIVRDGETGLLVPPGDAGALAAALSALVGDPELAARLGERGRDHVAREFAWPVIIRRLLALYERLAGTRTAVRTG